MTDQPLTAANQAALDEIKRLLDAMPDEDDRIRVLTALLAKRCKKCLDYNESGEFWCCHESRGG